jgi:hypothetical protein
LSIVDACIKSSKTGKKISIKKYWLLLLFLHYIFIFSDL